MEENKTLKKKLRVLEKAIELGMKSEKDYANMSAKDYHDLQKKAKFRENDSDIFFELSEAIKEKRLIAYLAESTESEGKNGTEILQ